MGKTPLSLFDRILGVLHIMKTCIWLRYNPLSIEYYLFSWTPFLLSLVSVQHLKFEDH